MVKQQVQYEEFDSDFDAFVKSTMEDFNTAGMAVLMLHGDRTWAKGFGFSDVNHKTPVTPETLFFAGSTTKSFTSAMAASLAESDEYPDIKWDTPLAKLIKDDFVLDQSSPEGRWATERITLEDALSHRTGMSRHDLIWMNGDLSNGDIVRSLRHVPVTRDLRTKFEYCNNMYTAVAHSVATTFDTPYETLLKEHIFGPLGMESTTTDLTAAQSLAKQNHTMNLARGHLWDAELGEFVQIDWDSLPSFNGAGGIISNVLDYSIWLRHLLKPTNQNAALSEQAVAAMRAPRMLVESNNARPYVGPEAYGLGMYSQVYRGREILQHAGAISGYMASFLIVPPTKRDVENEDGDNGWAIVIMQNSYSLAQDIVTWHLLDTLLGTPSPERFDMAQAARMGQAKMEEQMQPDNVLQRLFGKTDMASGSQQMLEPESYAGIYEHIAYHGLQVSTTPPPIAGTMNAQGVSTLYLSPSGAKTSCGLWATLHHVSGNWWWAHRRLGRPSSWITDGAAKVQFVVSPDGLVTGMNFQAETSMPNGELAFFQKLE